MQLGLVYKLKDKDILHSMISKLALEINGSHKLLKDNSLIYTH